MQNDDYEYAGKKVRLIGVDVDHADAVIQNVDRYGWTFLVKSSGEPAAPAARSVFINHATPISFEILP